MGRNAGLARIVLYDLGERRFGESGAAAGAFAAWEAARVAERRPESRSGPFSPEDFERDES
jgi:hypothetical protein